MFCVLIRRACRHRVLNLRHKFFGNFNQAKFTGLPSNLLSTKSWINFQLHKWNLQYLNSVVNNSATFSSSHEGELNPVKYDKISTETLESLTDYFEELIESDVSLKSADVTYGDGVLTISFGKPHGTYVINKQSPNLQIWLSSPFSGPKRYDFINETWVYKHDNTTLHSLLDREIAKISKVEVEFCKRCVYGKDKICT